MQESTKKSKIKVNKSELKANVSKPEKSSRMGEYKFEIQNITEKILTKHNIDSSDESYKLKLSMPDYDDLVIEKEGDQILVGHYYHHPSGVLLSDPVLAFDYNEGYWFPVRIEQLLGNTVCSYVANGKRMINPYGIKEFKMFQKMFARNIREQGWLEDGDV